MEARTGMMPRAELAELARAHGPLVFRTAYRLLGDQAQAEDVQQEVFLRLLESSYDEVTSWPAYLTSTATRTAIDVLRRRQRWWGLLPMLRAATPDTSPSAEEAGTDAERAECLRAALATLPRREAQCFALRYMEHMEIGDIATALQLKANHVGVLLHRARRRLEAQLNPVEEEIRA